jgi:hypothetical protein
MIGAIGIWDILAHPVVTVRCFGWPVFFKALFSGQEKTFLSLIRTNGFFEPMNGKVSALVQRCVDLELRGKRIYETLAEQFATTPKLKTFLTGLARQEQDHAHLLETALIASRLGKWQGHFFDPWQDCIPRLERQMQQIESSLGSIHTVEEALQVVTQIEKSEINDVFPAILAASNSIFVRRLNAFQGAMNLHLSYIVERVVELGATFPPKSARRYEKRTLSVG